MINKKLNPVVTELFIRGRKRNIFIAFIIQSYFKVPKEVRLNTTHFFYHESSDVEFKDFMKIYIKCTAGPYSFLVNVQFYH